jgi:hypothetical protein
MLYRYGNGSYHHIDNHLNSQDCRAIHFINHIPKKTGNGNCKFPVCEPRMAYPGSGRILILALSFVFLFC